MTSAMTAAAGSPINIGRIVATLGIAQIAAWGTLYYAIAILGHPMSVEFGVAEAGVFGAFTVSLVVSGLIAPAAGSAIDRGYGRHVLTVAALTGAAGFLALALSATLWGLYLGWIFIGIAMGTGLYDAAFAILHGMVPATEYRRVVTLLTLWGGFASTVFWPLTQALVHFGGWRFTVAMFAVLQLGGCLPLYRSIIPITTSRATSSTPKNPKSSRTSTTFWWLAAAFALAAFTFSVLSVHLLKVLQMNGLSVAEAIAVGTIVGPMQVFARILEYRFLAATRPRVVGTLAFALLVIALLTLISFATGIMGAICFAICYGCSNGIMTIIRGTVPADLFGRDSYGALLGRLAAPAFVAKASAPFIFALLFAAGWSREGLLGFLVVIAVIAWASYEFARRHAVTSR